MAWAAAGYSAFELRLVRGDNKQHHTIGVFPAGGFQATFADGFDLNKAVRVRSGPHAVLGCRQDKLYILSMNSAAADLDDATATNSLALELLDIRNVPQDLQLGGYGAMSPFASKKKKYIDDSEMEGVDIEKRNIANSAVGAATTINMMGDSRFVMYDQTANTSFDINDPLCIFTPAHSDVFVIQPQSILNVDISTFGDGT